jgi:hypothetical protein
MKTPAAAMRWELWQKNRWAFIVLGGLFYLCIGLNLSLSFIYDSPRPEREPGVVFGILGLALTWLVLFVVFGHTDNDPRKGFSGFPARMFLLPVRTRTLIQWPVLYGIGAILFSTIAWALFVFWPIHVQPPLGYMLLLASTAMVSFQALVWGLASFPKTRIAALLVWAFGLIVMAVGSTYWSQLGIVKWILAGVLGAGLLSIEFGVKAERSGGWQGWHGWRRWLNPWVVWRRNSAVPFRSPLQAQLWIEWRRNGRLPLAILAGLAAVLICLTVFWVEDSFTANSADTWPEFLVILVLLACAVGGLMVPNDPATARYAMSPFIAVRPVSTADMFRVKFQVAIGVFIRILPLLVVLFILWLIASKTSLATLYHWRSQEEGFAWSPFFRAAEILALGVLVPYSLLLGAMQVWMTGRTPGFPWSFMLLLIAVMVAFIVGPWFLQPLSAYGRDAFGLTARTSIFGLALLLKMGVAYYGFRASHRHALISGRFIAGYVSFWLLVSGLLMVLSELGNQVYPADPFLCWLLILILPLGRVGWSPLALAWNRHR